MLLVSFKLLTSAVFQGFQQIFYCAILFELHLLLEVNSFTLLSLYVNSFQSVHKMFMVSDTNVVSEGVAMELLGLKTAFLLPVQTHSGHTLIL